MAAQMAQQQQHNDGQNASSSQPNIPGSYAHSQVTPSGAHDKQVSRPVLGVDSRLIPSASISDRNDVDISTGTQNGHGGDCIPKVAGLVGQKDQVTNQATEPPGKDSPRLIETGAQAQAVDPGLENTQVNQFDHSFPPAIASAADCIAPAYNLWKCDSEHKLDIEDLILEGNDDEQSEGNGAPRVDHVGVSLLPPLEMMQPDREDDKPTGHVNDVRSFSIHSCESPPHLLAQRDFPFADETQGRNFSSTTSSSQAGEEDEATLAGSTHLSVDAVRLASSAAFEKYVLPAASMVSQSLQPCAQRTTDRDQVSEQLLENASVSDQNVDWAGHDAGGIVPVNVIQQSDFDQDDIDVARGHVGIVPANAIQQPEVLEFDGNDCIDLAQARAERNHDAQASAGRRREYFMNANGDIDIVLACQEWIFGHLCLSCRENNREVTMVPCEHSVLCWRCFLESSRFHEQISRCPRCMQPTLGIKLSQDCLRRVLQLSQQE